jgi:hypothetical protein
MSITDSQARDVFRQYESDPIILQGMQAIAKALTGYSSDNNWYAIATPQAADGTCNDVPEGLGAYPDGYGLGLCVLLYQTPEQGISHALNLWFPQQADGTSGPEGLKFYNALKSGDTDTIAQMVWARVWWFPLRKTGRAQLGPLGPWTFSSDFYNAANGIAANLGEPMMFKMPGAALATIPVVPFPVDLGPIPLPSGQVPGGGPTLPGIDPPAPPVPPVPPAPPGEKKDEGMSTGAKILLALLLLGGGAAAAKAIK